MTTAFVAGATGFTGREVVRLIAAGGITAVAHVRPDSPSLDTWRDRFAAMGATVDATPWEARALAATLGRLRPELVFCLIGTTRKRGQRAAATGRPTESYETVDYGLTKLLADACVAAGHRPRFVYLSAAGASERAGSPYGRARWKAEQAVRTSGLPYTIARPSFIVGAGRDEPRPAELWGARAIDGLLAVAGAVGLRTLRERYRSTSNAVLAGALVRLARDSAALDATIESEGLR